MSAQRVPRRTGENGEVGVDLGRWQPLALDELADVMSGAAGSWWGAGGWAMELHLGRQTRAHADLDVLVLRRALGPVFEQCLRGWDLHAADPPGTLRPWDLVDPLPAHVRRVVPTALT